LSGCPQSVLLSCALSKTFVSVPSRLLGLSARIGRTDSSLLERYGVFTKDARPTLENVSSVGITPLPTFPNPKSQLKPLFYSDIVHIAFLFFKMAATDQSHAIETSKKVSFASDKTIAVEPTLPRLNYDELFAAYYTREEYESFRDEIDALVRSHQRTVKNKDERGKLCFRGLEGRTHQGARRKVANRNRAKNAVLQEQTRQKQTQDFDPEMLAEIYKGFCLTSVSQAHRIAEADAACSRQLSHNIVVIDYLPVSFCQKDHDDVETASTISSTGSLSTA
jgi:hypothetical protein